MELQGNASCLPPAPTLGFPGFQHFLGVYGEGRGGRQGHRSGGGKAGIGAEGWLDYVFRILTPIRLPPTDLTCLPAPVLELLALEGKGGQEDMEGP